jgi:hypothetical protein
MTTGHPTCQVCLCWNVQELFKVLCVLSSLQGLGWPRVYSADCEGQFVTCGMSHGQASGLYNQVRCLHCHFPIGVWPQTNQFTTLPRQP